MVGEASNGVEAVERYKELKPDLTTMDLVMPFKNGIEATREILRVDAKAVVVMCSALGQESLVKEAIEAGASDFNVKPWADAAAGDVGGDRSCGPGWPMMASTTPASMAAPNPT